MKCRGVQGVQEFKEFKEFEEFREFKESHDSDFAPIFEDRLPALAFAFAITNENVLRIN
jgi:hypothetical protein